MEKLALSGHEFITSQITKQEMERTTSQEIRGAALFIYKIFGGDKFLNKETYFATGFSDAPFSQIPFGGGTVTNTVLTYLRKFFEPEDARHIFQALSSHSDYFLTLDENSILKRYRVNHLGIKDFCINTGLKIANPVELVTELGL